MSKWIGNLLWSILNFDLKVWWLLFGILIFILIIFIISKFQKEESFKPDFYNYREDRFKKWRWTWTWEWSDSKTAWLISNLKAHCPNCNTPLIENSSIYSTRFDCPRCDFAARDGQCEELYKIEQIILDNVDRKRNKIGNGV